MKKVLVILIALSLLSVPAFAKSIKNSKHNLSAGAATQSGAGTVYATNVNGLCVFCHTPHGASQTVKISPLWNRDISATGISTTRGTGTVATYNSSSLSSESQPVNINGNLVNTDVLLCLSCHDGSSMSGGLVNPSNEVTGISMTWNNGSDVVQYDPSTYKFYDIGAFNDNGGENAGQEGESDLRDDHPIAMDYEAVVTEKGADDFHTGPVGPTTGESLLRNGLVWCSSCHDVHDNEYVPFLRDSNSSSALCLACHNK